MKILIADDEELIRQSILFFLVDLGIRPEDTFQVSDGLALLKALKISYFDLALVDIRMPGMNGLEAIRLARQTAVETNFYILSGFDDFKYAQEVIRLGVKDYILKPIKKQELKNILTNCTSLLEQRRKTLSDHLKLNALALLNISGYQTEFPVLCHPLLITDDLPETPFSMTLKDHNKIIGISHRIPEGTVLFIFETPQYPACCKAYIRDLEQRHKKGHTLLEGNPFRSSRNWENDFTRMKKIAALRPAFGSHQLYPHTCQSPEAPAELHNLCRLCLRSLETYAKSDYAGFTITCEALIKNIEHTKQSYPKHVNCTLRFIEQAFCLKVCTIDQLKKELSLISSMISGTVKNIPYEEIITYITLHYKENISLSELADKFRLSPNYFSTLFKKKTGYNYTHYLTTLRIEEGKRLLLETNLPIHEIARQVGYYSTSFFIQAFKKNQQATPSEYRRQNQSLPS